MTRLRVLFAVIAVGVVVGGWSLGDDPPPKYKGQLPKNWKKLSLDQDQVQKIYKVQKEYHDKIAPLEQKIKQLKAEEYDEELKVLTKAQRERLKEISEIKTDPEPKKDGKDAISKDKKSP